MFLLNNINTKNKKTALITENNKQISYSELNNYINRFNKNLQKRSLVFLICKNNLESIVGYLSLLKKNCVISLLDEKISEKLLKKLIRDYKPDYIFLSKNKKYNLNNFSQVYNFFDYKLIESKKVTKKNLHKELSLLISTSGSTGSSKLVRQSKNNLKDNAVAISKCLTISKKDIAITTLPMSYVYGLSIINTHINQGATIVLNTKSIVEKSFWSAMQRHKVTNFGGVPYTYSILEKINLSKFNLKNLKYSTQAGGKLNINTAKKILEDYKKLNIKLFIMYGSAEATARMSYLPWKNIEKKISSIGVPISGGRFHIEDENKKKITSINKFGELIYKGSNVCMGYSKNFKDLYKGDENNGILRTGDLAYKDKDNFYYIVGRKDRYIKIYGMRINLQDLEEIILEYGAENICLEEKLNKILVFVRNYKKIKMLKKYLIDLTSLHPSSIEIRNIKEFPLNSNYKISYNKAIDI